MHQADTPPLRVLVLMMQVGPEMLKDLDVHWVILGHSERRHVIGESDSHIGDKIKQALSTGLKVIACIGETESQRDSGEVGPSCASATPPCILANSCDL